jgi:hypothetical protein
VVDRLVRDDGHDQDHQGRRLPAHHRWWVTLIVAALSENGQSEAHIRGMAQGLSAPLLTHEEFVSLRDCAKDLMHS